MRRSGFAYGTLTCHVERGEERFAVEWLADDSVWYDLRAFSRPQLWAARLAKPVARAPAPLRARFGRCPAGRARARVSAQGAATRSAGALAGFPRSHGARNSVAGAPCRFWRARLE